MSALIQGSEQWLELRKTKVTATDASTIMGESNYNTPYNLWCEKIGIYPRTSQTARMKRGLDMEEQARQAFEIHTGIFVFPRVMIHPVHEWMMASLDGIDVEGKNLVEIKCPGKVDHDLAKAGIVPSKYVGQLQHQMMVTGLDSMFYWSYDGSDGELVIVKRDPIYCDILLEKEKAFYKCMTSLVPPPILTANPQGEAYGLESTRVSEHAQPQV